MSGLPKQQDHVAHFCATKSWIATNSETMQSRSLTAKPLILDSTTLRTLRPQTPEPSSARNGKTSNLLKASKIIETRAANQNPSTNMPCAQKTAHLEKMVGESRGRVRESRTRVGESRGRVGDSRGESRGQATSHSCVYKEAKTGESGESRGESGKRRGRVGESRGESGRVGQSWGRVGGEPLRIGGAAAARADDLNVSVLLAGSTRQSHSRQ